MESWSEEHLKEKILEEEGACLSTSNSAQTTGIIWSKFYTIEVDQVLSIIFSPNSLFLNTKFWDKLIAYVP
jgi:hypothetical protein